MSCSTGSELPSPAPSSRRGVIAQEMASEPDSRPVASIMGTQLRTSPRDAALANAIAAHALDFDDSSLWADGHPSAAIVSATVALGEMLQSSTGQVIEAIVAGLQGQARFALASRSITVREWIPRHRHLRHLRCRRCLRTTPRPRRRRASSVPTPLAATQAAGLKRPFGTMGKHLNAAKAAIERHAVSAAGGEGISPHRPDGFEGRQGFAWTHSTTFDPARPEVVMGDRLAIESILFKRHACCHGTHSIDRGDCRASTLSTPSPRTTSPRCELFVPEKMVDICCISDPVTGLEGKFSMRHAASVALAGLATGPEAFTDEECATILVWSPCVSGSPCAPRPIGP